jgi:hypothetical protein
MPEAFQQHKDTERAGFITNISMLLLKNYIIFKEID